MHERQKHSSFDIVHLCFAQDLDLHNTQKTQVLDNMQNITTFRIHKTFKLKKKTRICKQEKTMNFEINEEPR